MNKTRFEFKGTKEQSAQICKNAICELLKVFDIRQTEDLLTRDLTIKMTPKEVLENADKMFWFNIFMHHRKEIIDLINE